VKPTERTTSTGFVLKAVDGGKASGKRQKRGKPRREKPQTTIWDVIRDAERREDRGKTPPDEPPKGAG
jgi:hypothetical protein